MITLDNMSADKLIETLATCLRLGVNIENKKLRSSRSSSWRAVYCGVTFTRASVLYV